MEFANVILLNKTDLVPASEVERLAACLRQLNPGAHVIPTRNAEVSAIYNVEITNNWTYFEFHAKKMEEVQGAVGGPRQTLGGWRWAEHTLGRGAHVTCGGSTG